MLVLDTNILMRAVLGKRARALLAKYGERIEFVAPDAAFEEARTGLPQVPKKSAGAAAPFSAAKKLPQVSGLRDRITSPVAGSRRMNTSWVLNR